MISFKKTSLLTLIVLLIILGLVGVYGSLLLRRHSAYARFIAVDDLAAIQIPNNQSGLQQLAQDFEGDDQ